VVLLKTSFILHLTPRPATQKNHHEEGGGKNGDHAADIAEADVSMSSVASILNRGLA
jgi:hypothetical protein